MYATSWRSVFRSMEVETKTKTTNTVIIYVFLSIKELGLLILDVD